jgi:hypothetical protein
LTEAPLVAFASVVASPALGVCRTSDDLRAILRARFTELGISYETVDAIAGLPTRYTAKILGMQPTKSFGAISLDGMLGASGLMLIAVADEAALERVRNRLEPSSVPHCGRAKKRHTVVIKFTTRFLREMGSLGGRKKHANALHRRHVSDVRREAANKRWQRATAR